MRRKEIKINGEIRSAILLGGISKRVKIYSVTGYVKPWICVRNKWFTLQDELNQTVLDFLNLKYQSSDRQDQILKDFNKIVETYS